MNMNQFDRDRDMDYIEDISDLGINIDSLKFEEVKKVTVDNYEGKVHDLKVNNLHNYQTDIGIAHNGGGSL